MKMPNRILIIVRIEMKNFIVSYGFIDLVKVKLVIEIRIYAALVGVMFLTTSFSCLLLFGTQNVSAGSDGIEQGYAIQYSGGYVYIAGTTTSYTRGGQDIVVIKMDKTDGHIIWYRTWGNVRADGSSGDDVAHAISVTASYVYVAGSTQSLRGDVDIVILKYDTDGNQLFGNFPIIYDSPNHPNDCAFAIVVKSYIYVAGYTQRFPQLNDVFVKRYQTDGSYIPPGDWTDIINVGDYLVPQTNGNDIAYSMIVTTDNIFLAGATEAKRPNQGVMDLLLLKLLRSDGTVITSAPWPIIINFGAGVVIGNSIAYDGTANSNTFYVICNSVTNGVCSALYLKYDFSGAFSWKKNYTGPLGALQSYGNSIAVDSTFIYMTGDYQLWVGQGPNVHYNAFIIKRDLNGNIGQFGWDNTWGGGSDELGDGISIDIANPANVYSVITSSSFQNGYANLAILKYSSAGIAQWNPTPTFGDSLTDIGYAITCDGAHNEYITGSTNSYSDGKDFLKMSYPPDSNIFLVKYDYWGNKIWETSWDGGYDDCAFGVVCTSSNVFVVGYSYQDFWGSGVPQKDIVILKYDANTGKLLQQPQFWDDGSHLYDDCAYACTIYNYKLYVTGFTYSPNAHTLALNKDLITLCYDFNLVLQPGWPLIWTRNNDIYNDCGYAIAICQDPNLGNSPYAYIAGDTNYPYRTGNNGDMDTFLQKLDIINLQNGYLNPPAVRGGNGNDGARGLCPRYNPQTQQLICIYETGFMDRGNHHDEFVIRYNTDCTLYWIEEAGSGNNDDIGYSVIPSYGWGTCNVIATRNGNTGLIIQYTDSDNGQPGIRSDVKQWGGNSQARAGMTDPNTNNCIVTGSCYSNNFNLAGSYDAQTDRFDQNSNFNWLRLWG